MPEPELRYLVIPNTTNPYLLARVRWPDVAQAITAGCPDWLEDPGLFDLPDDPSSSTVTFDQAAAIAAAWGVSLSEETLHPSGPSLIRRMPANWSDLAPAEIRAWALDFVETRRRVDASPDTSRARARHASSTSRRRRWLSLLRALPGSPRRHPLEAQAGMAEFPGPPTVKPALDESWDLGIESLPSIAVLDTASTVAGDNGHGPISTTVGHSTIASESEARSFTDNSGELEPSPTGQGDVSI